MIDIDALTEKARLRKARSDARDERIKFWVPVVSSVLSLLAGIGALLVALVALLAKH